MKEVLYGENAEQIDNKTENYDEILIIRENDDVTENVKNTGLLDMNDPSSNYDEILIIRENDIKENEINTGLLDMNDPNSTVQNEPISSKQISSTSSVTEDEHAKLIRQDVEKGIITVNEGEKKENLDPELLKLENIPRFEPLIKPHIDTGFILGGLWGSTPQVHEKEPSFGYESLFNFSSIYQSHIKKCVNEICEDQRVVMDAVKSADEYCAQINQSIMAKQLQAKTNYEQISVVNGLIKQVEKTHKLVYEIFQTLNKLEKLMPEEGDQPASSNWPTIHKLCLTAKQRPSHTMKIPQRSNSSIVGVSQYNVLSDKHKDSEVLTPVQTTDWMASIAHLIEQINPIKDSIEESTKDPDPI